MAKPLARLGPRPLLAAVLVLIATLAAPVGASAAAAQGAGKAKFRVLLFMKSEGFRHESMPDARRAIRRLGRANRFRVDATGDARAFRRRNLSRYAAVIFALTTGEVLGPRGQAAFKRYIREGGGFVGIHSAADTEREWNFYGELLGARFKSHPQVQPATVEVADRDHPSTRHLGRTWARTDEWYDFEPNPRGRVHVLATLDESTYRGATMGSDHPIAWCRHYGGGRSWYTGGGHTPESYSEPAFRRHLLGGIRWAAGDVGGDCRTVGG